MMKVGFAVHRHVDADGNMKRPWCPATRILEHREMERLNREAQERRKASQAAFFGSDADASTRYRHDFPDIKVSSSRSFCFLPL